MTRGLCVDCGAIIHYSSVRCRSCHGRHITDRLTDKIYGEILRIKQRRIDEFNRFSKDVDAPEDKDAQRLMSGGLLKNVIHEWLMFSDRPTKGRFWRLFNASEGELLEERNGWIK